jgi:hypothetical protein
MSPRAVASRSERPAELPLVARLLLVDPDRVARRLDELRRTGRIERVPNTWQIFLGVLRMWHRMFFRSGSVGTSTRPVRPGLRAKLLSLRPLRFPFLLRERAIAPLDFSGLLSTRERVLRHLVGAHHDKNQFVYDLDLLDLFERGDEHDRGALEELLERAKTVVESDTPRSRFLRDLTVFEGYHESLLRATEAALTGHDALDDGERSDPDISFRAYLAWCARQPETPEATIALVREGRYTIDGGAR